MICPLCQTEMCYTERDVFFVDTEMGEEIELLVKASWCTGCGEVSWVKRVGD